MPTRVARLFCVIHHVLQRLLDYALHLIFCVHASTLLLHLAFALVSIVTADLNCATCNIGWYASLTQKTLPPSHRHKQSESTKGRSKDFADAHVSCLLPWHETLHHLELHNMLCIEGEHNHSTDRADRLNDKHVSRNLSFLSGLSVLQSLHLDNVQPLVTSEDLAKSSALQMLHIRMPEKQWNHDPYYALYDDSRFLDKVTLELPACTLLRELHCESCELTKLDVSACGVLEVLYISNNQVKELDLSNNPLLKKVSAVTNQLEQLDVTGCKQLEKLDVGNNPLSQLWITGCTSLKELSVTETDLLELDLTGCSGMTRYGIGHYPPLTKITLTGCTSLEELEFVKIDLVSLDLTGLTKLKKLTCDLAKLTSLTVAGCTSLAWMDVNAPKISSLDLSSCSAIGRVRLEGCGLETVNLAGCSKLVLFDCKGCKLTALDLTSCCSLRELGFSQNNLTSVDVSSCPLLVKLDCSFNPVEAFCIVGCDELVSVNCPGCAHTRNKGKPVLKVMEPTPKGINVEERVCPQHEGTCVALY